MTDVVDRQHVRFLGAVLAGGFGGVTVMLALLFAESTATMLFVGEAILLGTIALEAFSPASIVGGAIEVLVTLADGLGVGIAQAMPLVIIVAGVLLWRYFKNKDRDIIIQGRQK